MLNFVDITVSDSFEISEQELDFENALKRTCTFWYDFRDLFDEKYFKNICQNIYLPAVSRFCSDDFRDYVMTAANVCRSVCFQIFRDCFKNFCSAYPVVYKRIDFGTGFDKYEIIFAEYLFDNILRNFVLTKEYLADCRGFPSFPEDVV